MIVDDPARALPIVERLADARRPPVDRRLRHRLLSLEYLKVLPVAEMKIDRSFVAGMADDVRDAAIVRHSIDLGRSLGLRVVAEGVESARGPRDRLAGMGCDHAQGFYYSRAGPGRGVRGVGRRAEAVQRRTAECRRRSPAARRSPRGAPRREKPLEGGTAPRRPSPLRVLPCVARKATSKPCPRLLAGMREDSPGPRRPGRGGIPHTD